MAKIGATGNFPSGKLNETDEGELIIAIAADPATGTINIQFGKPVNWLGLYPHQADAIAEMLKKKADELRNRAIEIKHPGNMEF